MVDFVRLQQIVRDKLEQDRNIRTVTATGGTLEAAVAEAAVLLDLPVRKLEYEVTEKGSLGHFGQGKKNWAIKAYERIIITAEDVVGDGEGEEDLAEVKVNPDADGEVFLYLSSDGAFLKVIAPRGKGRKAHEDNAFHLLGVRQVRDYDRELVSGIVREAVGEYIKVGDFERQPEKNSVVTVEISESEMKAYIIVTPPGVGGCDISLESFLSHLRFSQVIYGINEELLRDFIDHPVYKQRVVAAEGLMPVNGRNAYMQYKIEMDQSHLKLREGIDGRIDFKDINIIKNVVQNQPLGKMIPPEQGVFGRTVTGKVVPAANGKDIPIPMGKNVRLGDDDATVIAEINGQVVIVGGKINVEPIYTVNGDVNLKTGNIIFLGTVVINGSVEDGFSVKAAGNIVVNGTVTRAELDAEGDIIVHQGITGKSSNLVRAGNSIWAKFIENTTVEAGNSVVVTDGIINSHVDAHKSIICQGKRANIVGGKLRASEEINAKILGNPTSGTETICEVGVDPKTKMQFGILMGKKTEMEKQLEDIKLNMQTLINIKKQRKSLPEDKEVFLREMMDKRQILMADLKKNNEEMDKIHEIFNNIKTRGRISASAKVYPGVKIIIRDAVNDVRSDYRAVTFVLENNLIRVVKYEEPDEEANKAPDGYTTN